MHWRFFFKTDNDEPRFSWIELGIHCHQVTERDKWDEPLRHGDRYATVRYWTLAGCGSQCTNLPRGQVMSDADTVQVMKNAEIKTSRTYRT